MSRWSARGTKSRYTLTSGSLPPSDTAVLGDGVGDASFSIGVSASDRRRSMTGVVVFASDTRSSAQDIFRVAGPAATDSLSPSIASSIAIVRSRPRVPSLTMEDAGGVRRRIVYKISADRA